MLLHFFFPKSNPRKCEFLATINRSRRQLAWHSGRKDMRGAGTESRFFCCHLLQPVFPLARFRASPIPSGRLGLSQGGSPAHDRSSSRSLVRFPPAILAPPKDTRWPALREVGVGRLFRRSSPDSAPYQCCHMPPPFSRNWTLSSWPPAWRCSIRLCFTDMSSSIHCPAHRLEREIGTISLNTAHKLPCVILLVTPA